MKYKTQVYKFHPSTDFHKSKISYMIVAINVFISLLSFILKLI